MYWSSIVQTLVSGFVCATVTAMAVPALAQSGAPFPSAGQDRMGSVMTHRVEVLPGFPMPAGLYDVEVEGPTIVNRGNPALVGGAHQIATEIVEMNLVGSMVGPVSIPVQVRESPTRGSIGLVREQTASAFPGHFPADSFFDVFIEFDLPGVTIFNKDAAYVFAGGITSLPPPFPTQYPVKGWIDEGSPLIGQFIDLGNPPAGFNQLPLPLYMQNPTGGPDILVGFLLDGIHTVPGPGALAVLALTTMAGVRRRSR